jgi:hypothetical protein
LFFKVASIFLLVFLILESIMADDIFSEFTKIELPGDITIETDNPVVETIIGVAGLAAAFLFAAKLLSSNETTD